MKFCKLLIFTVALLLATESQAQNSLGASAFAGMWSDPPHTAEGLLCFLMCTDEGLELLYSMMDDPAYDNTPYLALRNRAMIGSIVGLLRPRTTEFSAPSFPLDNAKESGFIACEPWGLGKQVFAPHQLEFTIAGDRIEMHYGEWDARRTVYMDGRVAPADQAHSLLGYSIGTMDGDSLVIKTSYIEANTVAFLLSHSDQLQTEERYTISKEGQTLAMQITFSDPIALTEPVTIKKIWSWSPDEVIYPYEDCEIPVDYINSLGGDI